MDRTLLHTHRELIPFLWVVARVLVLRQPDCHSRNVCQTDEWEGSTHSAHVLWLADLPSDASEQIKGGRKGISDMQSREYTHGRD